MSAVPMFLTSRDQEILEALACKVRVFLAEQIAGTWWPDAETPIVHAGRRLTALHDAGFVDCVHLPVDRMLTLAGPLFEWQPGQAAPDFDATAYQLQSRWNSCPPSIVPLYVSTPETNNTYGGPTRRKALDRGQVSHDLHLSAVYLEFRKTAPDKARVWVGEDCLPKAGYRLKDPDAVLQFADGSELIVEFGGRYDARRVRDFHEDCVARERPYELW